MKKLLTLVLALLMLAALSVSALAYDGEIITLTADSDVDPFKWDPETDEMAKWIQDNFGLNLEQNETNFYNNSFDVLQLAANDDNLPDVFCADILYYPQLITQFIPEELVAEIPEELLDKYPLTKNLLENDQVAQLVKQMYGGYYFLPKPDSADPTIYVAERKGIFIRKDWLQNLGLEMPKSWEELYEVAHAFTWDDPDGNGKDDTFGLTGDGLGALQYFFASTGSSNRYWNRDEDGNWYYGALDDKNAEVLGWLRKMYEDRPEGDTTHPSGSLDPDFGATTWQEGLRKFSSNQFGLCVRNADADWINGVAVKYYGAANPDCNPFDRIDLIPSLGLNKGDPQIMDAYISCMVATMFSPDITEEELDRFLNYFEYLISDEGKYLRLGFEGVDWYREDGKIKLTVDEQGNNSAATLATRYPCSPVTHWPSWGFELQAYPEVEYFAEYNDETKALNAAACAVRNQHVVYPEIGPMLIEDDAVTDITAFGITSEYWQIITGTDPVDEMFADMKERAETQYFNAAKEVIEEKAEEFGW